MSSYLELHVGPYMLVSKLPIKKDVVKNVCVNSDCTQFDLVRPANQHSFVFCPACGEPNQDKTFVEDDYKDVRDIIYSEKFQDTFIAAHNGGTELSDKFAVLLPNAHIRLSEPGIDMYETQIVEIKPDRMTRELAWFMHEYTEIIAAIIAEFGESAVQIKWGIIKHYN